MTDITDAGPRLRAMNDRLQDNTPAANDTQSEGSVQNGCTLTDEEREAVENCIYASERIGDDWSDKQAAILRSLLARLSPAAT